MFGFLLLWLAALLAIVEAIPLSARDIDSNTLSQLIYYAQYSAAAYCKADNEQASSTPITCLDDLCPLVETNKAFSVLEFENIGLTDATGFVAIDNVQRQIIIAFRGSKSVPNWLSDLNILPMEGFPLCDSCAVHPGFLQTWMEVKPIIMSVLQDALAQYQGYSVVVTGHSLGGAVATLAAAELRQKGYPVAMYTYGSPMVGNAQFATFVTNQMSNYRVTHEADLFPRLPGRAIGYRHVGPEYWITTDDIHPGTGDVKLVTGDMSNGNMGVWIPNPFDHLYYFEQITTCDPVPLELF